MIYKYLIYVQFSHRGCVGGVCTAPNQCTCRNGFTLDPTGTKCEGKCDRPCLNGRIFIVKKHIRTVLIKIIFFLQEFVRDQINAVVMLAMSWIQLIHSGKNRFIIIIAYFIGLTLHLWLISRCIAHCAGGCPNGVCSGPDFCLCHPGFIKDRTSRNGQSCIPRT